MTDLIFRHLIHSRFVRSSNDSIPETVVSSSHEAGALRYTSGCVCKHLRKKLNMQTIQI